MNQANHQPMIHRVLLLAAAIPAATLTLAAQQSTGEASSQTKPARSAAEQQFLTARWQETAKGELDQALAGYLKAAKATGPESIRARALLLAAGLQHRLGKPAAAQATLQTLLGEFPSQSEVMNAAKIRLKEWRQIELRRTDSDAYRRHLFTPEVQAKILKLLEALAIPEPQGLTSVGRKEFRTKLAATKNQILVYGRGAIPGLQAVARTGVSAGKKHLTTEANSLLFQLGTLPPVSALLADTEWMGQGRAWQVLFRLPAVERVALSSSLANKSSSVARILRAAISNDRQALLQLLQGEAGADLVHEEAGCVTGLALGLLDAHGLQAARQLMKLARDIEAPIRVRRAIEAAITEREIPGLNAAAWLGWARDRLSFEATLSSVTSASVTLRREDTKTLDQMLSWIGTKHGSLRESLVEAMAEGLQANRRPLQVPWNADRVYRLITMVDPNGSFDCAEHFDPFWRSPDGAKMLAEAVCRNPTVTVKIEGFYDSLREDRDDPLHAQAEEAWQLILFKEIEKSWPRWTSAQRGDILKLVLDRGLAPKTVRFTMPLLNFLIKERANAGPNTQKYIDAALQEIAERKED